MTRAALLGFASSLLATSAALAGHESNGGNVISMSFSTWGHNIHGYLETQAQNGGDAILTAAQRQQLAAAVDGTWIEVVSDTRFVGDDGSPVHARVVADPLEPGSKKIQVEEAFWSTAVGDDPAVCRLVFHEYLRVIGVNDNQSVVSYKLKAPCDFYVNAGAVNLSFELNASADAAPYGWEASGTGYLIRGDATQVKRGQWSGKINPDWTPGAFGGLTQCIDAVPFRGRELRLIGYVMTYVVAGGHAGLWMRVDGTLGEVLAFDNMYERGLYGTMPWRPSIVELSVGQTAARVCFGALLDGYGAIWVDDLELTAR